MTAKEIFRRVLTWLRGERPPPSPNKPPQPGERAYTLGGLFGCCINMFHSNRVVGWMSPIPTEGALLIATHERTRLPGYWRMVNIRPQLDPPDMFFADLVFVGHQNEVPAESRPEIRNQVREHMEHLARLHRML